MSDKHTKALWRKVFIRVCRDSGFKLPWDRAAHLTGDVVGVPAMLVWTAFPYLSVMQEIAVGAHPAAHDDSLAGASA